MKKLLLLCAILPVIAIAQEPYAVMYWNQYALINPAYDGMLYKQQAVLAGHLHADNYYGAHTAGSASYGIRLDRFSSGIGVHYRYVKEGFRVENRAGINYNYRFKLPGDVTIAIGAGADYTQGYIDYRHSFLDTLTNRYYQGHVMVNAGITVKWKTLFGGISSTAVNQPEWNPYTDNDYLYPHRLFYAFAQYAIRLGDHFDLTPRAMVHCYYRGPAVLQYNLQATYNKNCWLGIGASGSIAHFYEMSVMAGWDINQKFRVGYAYRFGVDRLDTDNAIHEIVLAFMLQ